MPGLDGHAVTEALKVLHDDVPIIAVSGGGVKEKDELLLEAVRLGAAEVIMKPDDFRQLLGAVQRALSLLILVLLLPGAVHAQLSGPYRLGVGDTLAFRESTTTTVELHTPQASVVAGSSQDAVIEMTATGPGVVTAWYAELSVGSSGPNGEESPSTADLIREPYTLHVSGTGHVETEGAPSPPADVTAITDLTQQFFDFLVLVPDDRPAEGVVWTDTLVSTESSLPETTHELRAIRTYTARGDTTLDGVQAQIFETITTVEMESTSPMAGQGGLTATTEVSGEGTGAAYFDWEGGRLLGRQRSGRLEGVLRINAPQPVELPQSMSYESSLEAGGGR